jgi:hypothetical protein
MRDKHFELRQPSLEEMLADPIIWMVMKSNRVEEHELRSLLKRVAADLAGEAQKLREAQICQASKQRPSLTAIIDVASESCCSTSGIRCSLASAPTSRMKPDRCRRAGSMRMRTRATQRSEN